MHRRTKESVFNPTRKSKEGFTYEVMFALIAGKKHEEL